MSSLASAFLQFFYIYFPFLLFERIFRSSKPIQKTPHWSFRVCFLLVLRILIGTAVSAPIFNIFLKLSLPIKFWNEVPQPFAIALAFLTYSFVHYWGHRLRHKIELLWRFCHQMHHSPKTFDLSLTFYVHPVDVIFVIGIIFFTTLACGWGMECFAALALIHNLLDKAQHIHVRTPYWLGYILFRPEQHSLHHSTHDNNYGLIPLWDIIFGTYKNCTDEADQIGFQNAAQSEFWRMFFFKKVSR